MLRGLQIASVDLVGTDEPPVDVMVQVLAATSSLSIAGTDETVSVGEQLKVEQLEELGSLINKHHQAFFSIGGLGTPI